MSWVNEKGTKNIGFSWLVRPFSPSLWKDKHALTPTVICLSRKIELGRWHTRKGRGRFLRRGVRGDCDSCSAHHRPGLQGTSGSLSHPLFTLKFKMWKSWPKDIPSPTQLSDLVEDWEKHPRRSHQFNALSGTRLDRVLPWRRGGAQQDAGHIFANTGNSQSFGTRSLFIESIPNEWMLHYTSYEPWLSS